MYVSVWKHLWSVSCSEHEQKEPSVELNTSMCDVITELYGEPCTRHCDSGRQSLFNRRVRGSWNCTPSFVAQQPQQVCHPEFICRKSSCSPKHFVASLGYYKGKTMNRLRNQQWDFEESRAHQKARSEPNKLTLAQLQTKMFFTQERDTQRQKMQHIRVKRAWWMKSIRTAWDGNQTGRTVSTNTKEST